MHTSIRELMDDRSGLRRKTKNQMELTEHPMMPRVQEGLTLVALLARLLIAMHWLNRSRIQNLRTVN